MKKLIISASVILCLTAACTTQATDSDLLARAREFALALINKNESIIVSKYLENSPSFSHQGKLNDDIKEFLFSSVNGKKSVTDIVSIHDFQVTVIAQPKDVVTLLIHSIEDSKLVKNIDFLQGEWMRSYIACEFMIKEQELYLYQNVCFAETGGPFPQESEI